MLETIYTDFTTKLLPKIAEGLVMTKDYFMDLFGRYATYIFITDIIYAVLCLIAIFATIYIGYKIYKAIDDITDPSMMFLIFLAVPLIFSITGFIQYSSEAVKVKYIPEVVVFEKIKNYSK